MNRTSFEPDFRVLVATLEAGEPVVQVFGELDSGSCDELLETFRSILADGDTKTVTLDLSGLGFIDSAGIRGVIMLEREARDQGMPVVVVAPPNEVTELLRTAGMTERVQLRPGVGRPGADPSSPLERVELEFPRDPQSPARARAEVRELLAGRDQTQSGDVVLLTSELVTNAVVHPELTATDGIGLRIFTYEEGIRVEVDDAGGGFDPRAVASPGPERGRGLFLVDRFSTRWGTEQLDDDRGRRFVVWFELDWRDPRHLEALAE
jgi:anti-anti-sigma factor